MNNEIFIENINAFLKSCPSTYDYPLGGDTQIPTPEEKILVELFFGNLSIEASLVEIIRKSLSRKDAYSLLVFSLRMGVLSVERNDKRFLQAAFWGLFADDDLLDWRDVLVSLSILEDCLSRINGEITDLIHKNIELATEKRRKTMLDGYLRRSLNMRHVEAMGFKAIFKQDGRLSYVKCI